MKPPHKKSKDVELLEDFIGNMLMEEESEDEPNNQVESISKNKDIHTTRSKTAPNETVKEAETVTPQIITLSATQQAETDYDDLTDEHHQRLLQVQNLLSRMPGVQQAPIKQEPLIQTQETAKQQSVSEASAKTVEKHFIATESAIQAEALKPEAELTAKQEVQQTQTAQVSDADVFSDDVTREVTRAREMLGDSFQTLIFEVGKLPLAVPLAKLGGIHVYSEEDITPIFGTPDWFKGLIPAEQGNIMLVDTAQFIMPEKYPAIKNQLDYKYAILLDDTRWALACTEVREAKHLSLDDIRWSQKNSKNEWFAGMVVEFMCALLEVDSLINLLYQRGQSQKSS